MRARRILFLAICAALAADVLIFAVSLHSRGAGRQKRDELALWVGDREELSPEQREELYRQAAGKALSCVTINSEALSENAEVYLGLSNSAENECAVSLEILDFSTGELLARTDLIDPGYCLQSVPLEAPLPPGELQCLVRMHFYWMNNDAYVGSAARQLLLNVLY